jgi:elongation factor P
MKIAQEIRAGNVIMQGKDPMVVLRTEYAVAAPATVRMKLKSLLTRHRSRLQADDKMDQVILDKKSAPTPTRQSDVRVHGRRVQPVQVEAENGRRDPVPEDAMPVEVVFYDARPSRSSCRPACARDHRHRAGRQGA